MIPHWQRRPLAYVGIAFASLACSPEIVSYQAVPRRLCPGDSTWLRWRVKGSATLSSEPPVPGLGRVRSVDSALFGPSQSTVFTLTAHRFGSQKFARQEVTLLDPTSPRTIVDTTGALGVDSLQTIAQLDTAVWDPKARVHEVFGKSGRALVVIHAGLRAVLVSDAAGSITLRDTPLGGDWVIHAPLRPGEVIGDSAHGPPDRLRLLVHFACQP